MKIKHHPNGSVTITIPKHKRTISLSKDFVKYHQLKTNKLFVEFPKFNIDLKDVGIIIINICNNVRIKILNKEEYFVIFRDINFCLGKEYNGPITNRKINQIITKFFNSKFNDGEIEG